jgi:hypothetical protein
MARHAFAGLTLGLNARTRIPGWNQPVPGVHPRGHLGKHCQPQPQ